MTKTQAARALSDALKELDRNESEEASERIAEALAALNPPPEPNKK